MLGPRMRASRLQAPAAAGRPDLVARMPAWRNYAGAYRSRANGQTVDAPALTPARCCCIGMHRPRGARPAGLRTASRHAPAADGLARGSLRVAPAWARGRRWIRHAMPSMADKVARRRGRLARAAVVSALAPGPPWPGPAARTDVGAIGRGRGRQLRAYAGLVEGNFIDSRRPVRGPCLARRAAQLLAISCHEGRRRDAFAEYHGGRTAGRAWLLLLDMLCRLCRSRIAPSCVGGAQQQ